MDGRKGGMLSSRLPSSFLSWPLSSLYRPPDGGLTVHLTHCRDDVDRSVSLSLTNTQRGKKKSCCKTFCLSWSAQCCHPPAVILTTLRPREQRSRNYKFLDYLSSSRLRVINYQGAVRPRSCRFAELTSDFNTQKSWNLMSFNHEKHVNKMWSSRIQSRKNERGTRANVSAGQRAGLISYLHFYSDSTSDFFLSSILWDFVCQVWKCREEVQESNLKKFRITFEVWIV